MGSRGYTLNCTKSKPISYLTSSNCLFYFLINICFNRRCFQEKLLKELYLNCLEILLITSSYAMVVLGSGFFSLFVNMAATNESTAVTRASAQTSRIASATESSTSFFVSSGRLRKIGDPTPETAASNVLLGASGRILYIVLTARLRNIEFATAKKMAMEPSWVQLIIVTASEAWFECTFAWARG